MSFTRRIMYVIRYFRRPVWDSGVTPPELLEFLGTIQVGRAIDLGCGTGTNAIRMSQMGWVVTGLDFVPAAISQAKQKARRSGANVDFRVGEVTRLDGIDGPFHFALDLGCYHSMTVTEKSAYLRQLERVMDPGGIWFVYGFINRSDANTDIGITTTDLAEIQRSFELISRKDGNDHGNLPSAYFIFRKNIMGANIK